MANAPLEIIERIDRNLSCRDVARLASTGRALSATTQRHAQACQMTRRALAMLVSTIDDYVLLLWVAVARMSPTAITIEPDATAEPPLLYRLHRTFNCARASRAAATLLSVPVVRSEPSTETEAPSDAHEWTVTLHTERVQPFRAVHISTAETPEVADQLNDMLAFVRAHLPPMRYSIALFGGTAAYAVTTTATPRVRGNPVQLRSVLAAFGAPNEPRHTLIAYVGARLDADEAPAAIADDLRSAVVQALSLSDMNPPYDEDDAQPLLPPDALAYVDQLVAQIAAALAAFGGRVNALAAALCDVDAAVATQLSFESVMNFGAAQR